MDELTSSAAEVRRREREIVLARNAAALAPLLDLVASAERQVSEATIAVTTAAAAWGADPEEPPADLAAAVDLAESLQRELVSLEALEPTQHELDELRTSMTRLAEALETERAREADLLSKVDAMPAALAQGREAVTAAQRAVTQLPALRQAREAAETAREAADRAVAIGRELEQLGPTLLEAREVRADARDALHVVRARRLAGMAAQLASGLEPHRTLSGVRQSRAPESRCHGSD